MEQKGIQLLSVILILGLSALTEGAEAPAPCRCNVDPKTRVNCGPPGITAEKCENAGCCFSSEVPGVPWCFSPLPRQSQEQCAQQPSARVNCGYPYISAEECNNRGCCFDDSIVGVIWCFFPRAEEECDI
ncbi:trefoil factor 2-like [Gopherus flavomarginatus]|uniref:trefoil factor 2-like n=1 Tax=Gopherus flavomarginatus TaxID=286002 RepID=UPI0021CC0ECB|nr:trefoil factor 2-like [Gopherus flavomarginatus]